MGICEILTVIFVVCKLIGVISWSWWLVLLPEIIAVIFYIVSFGIVGRTIHKTNKKIDKYFDEDDFFEY